LKAGTDESVFSGHGRRNCRNARVGESGQSVHSGVLSPRQVEDGCVVLAEKLHPSGLSAREVSLRDGMLRCPVVGPDLNSVAEDVALPLGECLYYREQLLVNRAVHFHAFEELSG
jgi:hypothetical protein